MKVAIITGILGQAGRVMTELLATKDYKVIGVRRRSSRFEIGSLKKFVDNGILTIVEGDVSDPFSMDHIISKVVNDYNSPNHLYDIELFNYAAQSHVHTSFDQPKYTFDVTFGGVLNILEVMRKYPERIKLIQASSSEMFGSNYDTKYDNFKYQNEMTRFTPQSPYAIAKAAAHNLVLNYRNAYKLHASSAIMFNYESKYRGPEFLTQKVCQYVAKLRDDLSYGLKPNQLQKLKLGNLDSYRDFTYAGDTMYACWLMAQQEAPDDYVICSGTTYQIEYFVDRAFKSIGQNWKEWVEIDKSLFRPSEVDYLCGDCSKARSKLKWHRTFDLDAIIKQMVTYGRTNI
jgi:GDPmannose 4,6-dehydratase